MGCAGRVTSFAETSDGRYLITPHRRVPLPHRAGAVEPDALPPGAGRLPAVRARPRPRRPIDCDKSALLDALAAYLKRRGLSVDWEAAQAAPAEALVNSLSMALPFEPAEKQALLQAYGLPERLETLVALLRIDAAGDDDEPPSVQ